jgi:hypothetical protein
MSSIDDSHPRRYIYNDADLAKFVSSPAKQQLLLTVQAMGRSCASAAAPAYDPASPLAGLSPATASLRGSLTGMLDWLVEFPPLDTSKARFGNPAFRHWHRRLAERAAAIVHAILEQNREYPGPDDYGMDILQAASEAGKKAAAEHLELDAVADEEDRAAVRELVAYLSASFGHEVRLDYGTGHESSFQVFLYALCKLGCFGSTPDAPPAVERLKAITISIWQAYLLICRQLQTEYMLEPAGSHGVWGLDDYHCLPFYFGACQLQAVPDYTPASIHDDAALQRGDEYMYFGCIRFIKSLKKGVPFFESSPMLNDISNLATWSKVASGLLRLYEGEVIKKRQVVQHFVFGRIFAANWTPSKPPKEPPTKHNFRRSPGGTVAPMARAPWAEEDEDDDEDNDNNSNSRVPTI